jgi:hypothetical protein
MHGEKLELLLLARGSPVILPERAKHLSSPNQKNKWVPRRGETPS